MTPETWAALLAKGVRWRDRMIDTRGNVVDHVYEDGGPASTEYRPDFNEWACGPVTPDPLPRYIRGATEGEAVIAALCAVLGLSS